MRTVESIWEGFSANVIPADAPAIQRQEMRKAFYGGVGALLALELEIADLSEDAAVAVMNGLHQEVEAFFDRLVSEAG